MEHKWFKNWSILINTGVFKTFKAAKEKEGLSIAQTTWEVYLDYLESNQKAAYDTLPASW